MHRSTRSLARSLVPLAALAVLLSCKGQPREAVIGYAFPVSGAEAVRVASAEIAEWPRMDVPIRIVFDSLLSGDRADLEVGRAERFSETPGLIAVVGHGGSRGSLAAAPVYNARRVPQVVPTGTSRLLSRVGPWTFVLAPNDSLEGAFIGSFAAEKLGARRVAIFYVNDEYGTGLRDGVVAELRARGAAAVDQVAFNAGSDLALLVEASLTRARPEAVVVAGRQRESGVIAREVHRRMPDLSIITGDGALVLPALLDSAGPAAASLYTVAFWLPDAPDSLSQAFVARYRRMNHGAEPQALDAMSHDALLLVAEAIRTVGPRREAIRAYLTSLGRTRPPFSGVTGPVDFATPARHRLFMVRFRNGHPERVSEP